MDTKARPKTQLTPTGNPPIEHLQLTIMEYIKKYLYTNYKTPPKNFDQYSQKVLESLTKKKPQSYEL